MHTSACLLHATRTINRIAKPTNSRTSGVMLSTKQQQKMGGQGDPIKLRITLLNYIENARHTCFSKACGTKRRSSMRQLLILSRRRFSITCARKTNKSQHIQYRNGLVSHPTYPTPFLARDLNRIGAKGRENLTKITTCSHKTTYIIFSAKNTLALRRATEKK